MMVCPGSRFEAYTRRCFAVTGSAVNGTIEMQTATMDIADLLVNGGRLELGGEREAKHLTAQQN
jgi:hypothetical protein